MKLHSSRRVDELAFLFLHVERPRPINDYARVDTERKRYAGMNSVMASERGGTEQKRHCFLTATVYVI